MAKDPHELLEPYRRKRDFDRTPEPSGTGSTAARPSEDRLRRFVVQRHGPVASTTTSVSRWTTCWRWAVPGTDPRP